MYAKAAAWYPAAGSFRRALVAWDGSADAAAALRTATAIVAGRNCHVVALSVLPADSCREASNDHLAGPHRRAAWRRPDRPQDRRRRRSRREVLQRSRAARQREVIKTRPGSASGAPRSGATPWTGCRCASPEVGHDDRRAGLRQLPDRVVARDNPMADRLDAGGVVDPADVADLAGLHQRQNSPGSPGTAGAT